MVDGGLDALCESLRGSDTRLATVVGAPGSGKRQFATAAAARLGGSFRDGVVQIDIGAVPAPELVAPTIGRAIGVTADADRDSFKAALDGRALLVVLENVGSVAGGAVVDLVAVCGESRVLVTAEQRIGIEGEQVYELRAAPGARFGGSRLAAAIADALPSGFDAGEGLELSAVLELAWTALEEEQQRCLACLAVLLGGWSLDGAEAVCGRRVDDELAALEARRLIERRGDRFVMCPTVRALAAARLEDFADTARAHRRVADWLLEKTEILRQGLLVHAPPDKATEAELEKESGNLAATLVWAEANDPGRFVRLVGGAWFLYRRTSRTEARLWLERALALPVADADLTTRGDLVNALAIITWDAGDYERADPIAQEALAMRRSGSDPGRLADSLMGAANCAAAVRDFERAIALFDEVHALARETGNDWALRFALTNLGDTHYACGNLDQAKAYFEEALRYHEASGRTLMAVLTRALLGHVAVRAGDDVHGEELLRSTAEAVSRGDGESMDLMYALEGLAWVAAKRGDLPRAALLIGAADRIRAVDGFPVQDSERVARDAVRAALDAAGPSFEAAHAQGYALEHDAAVAQALAGQDSPAARGPTST